MPLGTPRLSMAAEWTYPADREAPARARHAVVAAARASGIAERTLDDIAIAVSEAVTNVVLHAYRDATTPEEQHVTVRVEAAPDAVTVSVLDRGQGILPRADSPGMGLGLPIIAGLAASVDMSRRDGGGGRIVMTFSR